MYSDCLIFFYSLSPAAPLGMMSQPSFLHDYLHWRRKKTYLSLASNLLEWAETTENFFKNIIPCDWNMYLWLWPWN